LEYRFDEMKILLRSRQHDACVRWKMMMYYEILYRLAKKSKVAPSI
jgi:hypothetical protein